MQKFENQFGISLPVDYLVFDLETTGFAKNFDLPIAIGFGIVRDQQLVHHGELILNWCQFPDLVCPVWLAEQLENIRASLQEKNENWIYTPEFLRQEGRNPLWCLQRMQQLMEINREAGAAFVGHNACNFDMPLLENVFEEYLGHKGPHFCFDDNEVFDTGCIVKAAIAHIYPDEGDVNLRQFFRRVFYHRCPGVKWNLNSCVQRYGLLMESDIDSSQLHRAGVDAVVTHRLFEELRNCQSLHLSESIPE
jgi:DNA polymerase III alpha subunit (gram-positive type)